MQITFFGRYFSVLSVGAGDALTSVTPVTWPRTAAQLEEITWPRLLCPHRSAAALQCHYHHILLLPHCYRPYERYFPTELIRGGAEQIANIYSMLSAWISRCWSPVRDRKTSQRWAARRLLCLSVRFGWINKFLIESQDHCNVHAKGNGSMRRTKTTQRTFDRKQCFNFKESECIRDVNKNRQCRIMT